MSAGSLSSDGSVFTAVGFGPSGVTSVIIAEDGGKFSVSVSASAPFTFTRALGVTSSTIRSIQYVDEYFICVGDAGGISKITSSGNDVTNITTDATSNTLKGVAYDATTGNLVAVGLNGACIYSADDGVSWAPYSLGITTDLYGVASNGDGGLLAVGAGGEGFYSSDGGVNWSDVGTGQSDDMYSVSGDSSNWVFAGEGGIIWKSDADGTSPTQISSPVSYKITTSLNARFLVGDSGITVGLDDALTVATSYTTDVVSVDFIDGDYSSTFGGYICISDSRIYFSQGGDAAPVWGTFIPLSDTYRSNDYIVLSGYVMLIGTSEYDSATGKYLYHSRRVRWTAPNTIADFTGVGAGSGDLNGRGQLLFGEVVNDRGILFESESISSISYTGLVADPWNYEKIREGLWSISNPVVTDDNLYFVGSDGLIYYTNGIDVSEVGAPFDMSKFDDFDYTKPVILGYSSEASALLVYRPGSPYELHVVRPETGQYSVITLPTFTVGTDTYIPKTIVPRNDNYLSTIMVSYVKSNDTSSGGLQTVNLEFGVSSITGKDTLDVSGTDYYDYYFFEIDTGEIFFSEEGRKLSIKHIIARTWSDGTTTGYLGMSVKSLEDDYWHNAGDPYGTITVTDAACTVAGTAVSNLLIGAAGTTVFATPCLAAQGRYYLSSDTGTTYTAQIEGTHYTITDVQEVTLSTALAGTERLYVFWDNEPYVRFKTGDIIESTEGAHIITGSTDWQTLTLDRYLSTDADDDTDATHVPSEAIPAGEGTIKLGINKLTEGVRVKVYIVPRTDSDCKVMQVTGLSIGYITTSAQKNVE